MSTTVVGVEAKAPGPTRTMVGLAGFDLGEICGRLSLPIVMILGS
jgi:hypothetical protein